jgi:hypothetical protein
MDMQEKVLSALKKVINEQGYEFTQQAQWANTGNVYVTMKGSFSTVISFHYDFQDGYASIPFFNGTAEPVGGIYPNHTQGFLKAFNFRYVESSKVEDMIKYLRFSLPKHLVREKKVAAKQKHTNDDIKTSLDALLAKHIKGAGTNMEGAIRDCITQLIHICADNQILFEERVNAAIEVYDEEVETYAPAKG